MLSRSAKAAANGRVVLSPLSPLPSPFGPKFASLSTVSQITLDPEVRAQRVKSTRKVGKILGVPPRLELPEQSTPVVKTPATAVAFGSDSSIMERLQDVLASPFSPKTFARSILSPALKTPTPPVLSHRRAEPQSDAAKRTRSLKPRRKPPPSMLPLAEPPRYTEQTPLSPFRFPAVVARAASSPVSPTTLLGRVSPITTLTEAQIRRQKMEKLSRCLGETVPKELVYPSFGQVTEQAEEVGSYLDLYRAGSGSVDDSAVGVKSPVPKDVHWENVALGETKVERSGSQQRKSLRRSRSLGDFFSVADIREMKSHTIQMAAREQAAVPNGQLVQSPVAMAFPTFVDPSVKEDPTVVATLPRKKSLADAKASIIGTDAKLMAQFRMGFGTPGPVDPKLTSYPPPPPSTPLSSPSIPSAWLAVKSPHAPYWVKPTFGKTPRTLRFERRMGWGGSWNVGSIGEMMTQLKEL